MSVNEYIDETNQVNYMHVGDTVGVCVKVVNMSDNELPRHATEGSAGMDVQSNIDMIIEPGYRALISTGLYFAIPKYYEIQVRSRSGMALKSGVMVGNSPGTIDSDYRGELKIILINHSDNVFEVNKGDRIAQILVKAVPQILFDELEKIEDLPVTVRHAGGFGSTDADDAETVTTTASPDDKFLRLPPQSHI